jgi:zinc transporter 2
VQIADPICTFIFAVLVLLTTRSIILDITHTLMERTPQHVNLAAVTQTMTRVRMSRTGGLRM